jgi:hypothetical protein
VLYFQGRERGRIVIVHRDQVYRNATLERKLKARSSTGRAGRPPSGEMGRDKAPKWCFIERR